MISLGLTAAEMALFTRSLSTHHSVKITVQILDLNHRYLGDLTAALMDGQVNIDGDAEVTRNLTMQLLDPDRTLQLDSSSPNDGALFYDRMIRVVYSVKSELLPRWVDVPVFCGPVTKMSRTADVINVEAQGKETLVMPPTVAFYARTYGKGWNRTSLIKSIMINYGGETKFSIPAFAGNTAGPVIMNGETNLWALVKSINGSFAYRHLFYDGRGVLVNRWTPKTSTWTFRTGPGGNVTTLPTVDYDMSIVRNTVKVKGAIPKGGKTPVTATVGLPRTHPLNAYALGRNGKPRVIMEIIDDDNMKTIAQARALATSRVNSLALQGVEVRFDALVAPHLEPEDIYTLQTPDFAVTARLKQMTIPLKSAVSSVGYLVKRSTNRTRIRRR